ncbi:hypothetical protein [Clostridium sp. AM58-1XD]|uniref:hypothetical protein n=1 Tax=Clostridium sp. AM58-1XD TaxID=2292307 RepID=UPI0011C18E29|nr:hypothetical protein [Clostridium sp. AM58-1XD]
MKKRLWTENGKLNNRGSAMLLVLTVISLIALLGFMSLSAAVTNWQIRMLGRKSERNFYFLETALDEIYSGLGEEAGECLKRAMKRF